MMRPSLSEDRDEISAMIHRRSVWLEERGLAGWDDSAEVLAAQAGDAAFPMWVLTESGVVIGMTCLYEGSPAWFWTEHERAESAFFMATTVTDPAFAGQRLGCKIAWWVLDHAARTGKKWVRRGTIEPRLVHYYTRVQGWSIVRQQERDGFTVTGLARRAELQPGLGILTALPAGASSRERT